ncbi:alpha/beta hydrolase [Actinomadura flavalba]|uniref:alpha/beta hydrolase n=1 Tax=Actinomadura flavalba TaxID=1120938 RepID=UPI000380BE1C|nr:alpha/beta hydrolase-fold protein [Actinomadura flavalba]
MTLEVLADDEESPRLRHLRVRTPSVPGRVLSVRVLLPEGWSRDVPRPLLTLHHGGLDDGSSWLQYAGVEDLSRNDDILIVMPDGGRAGGYADWRRGPQWMTFHVHEVFALMRDRYGASPVRAVAGVSGGGYGALLGAAQNPGTFRFAAALSAPCTIRTPLTALTLLAATAIAGRTNPLHMWGWPVLHDRFWRRADPTHLASSLKGTALYLSASRTGRRGPLDPPDAPWSAANLAEPLIHSTLAPFLRRLRHHDIPATIHLYDHGTHTWPYWHHELHRAWPLLTTALSHP